MFFELFDRFRHWKRMPSDLATGRYGEDLAHRFLRRRGYTVVARNWRPPSGGEEVDLIAWERDTLVFVEVKTRSSEDFGTPDRAVDREKREALSRAARAYAGRAVVPQLRFDVVNVVLEKPPRLELLRDAFRLI